jgi:hypothetical protein
MDITFPIYKLSDFSQYYKQIIPLSSVKFNIFTVFNAIDFQFNVNLLDFFPRIKGGYKLIQRLKNDSIQF